MLECSSLLSDSRRVLVARAHAHSAHTSSGELRRSAADEVVRGDARGGGALPSRSPLSALRTQSLTQLLAPAVADNEPCARHMLCSLQATCMLAMLLVSLDVN